MHPPVEAYIAPPVPAEARQTQAWHPRPFSSPVRIGCGHLTVIAGLSGCANVFFVGAVLGSRAPFDLVASWIFGTLLAAAVGLISTSVGVRE